MMFKLVASQRSMNPELFPVRDSEEKKFSEAELPIFKSDLDDSDLTENQHMVTFRCRHNVCLQARLSVLAKYSFFQVMFSGKFCDSATEKLIDIDATAEEFGRFLDYLHGNRSFKLDDLFLLYVFANRFCMEALVDFAVSGLIHLIDSDQITICNLLEILMTHEGDQMLGQSYFFDRVVSFFDKHMLNLFESLGKLLLVDWSVSNENLTSAVVQSLIIWRHSETGNKWLSFFWDNYSSAEVAVLLKITQFMETEEIVALLEDEIYALIHNNQNEFLEFVLESIDSKARQLILNSQDGHTVLDLAFLFNSSVVNCLVHYGARTITAHPLSAFSNEFYVFLHSMTPETKAVVLNLKDENGKTPLDIACAHFSLYVDALVLHGARVITTVEEIFGPAINVDSVPDFQRMFKKLMIPRNGETMREILELVSTRKATEIIKGCF